MITSYLSLFQIILYSYSIMEEQFADLRCNYINPEIQSASVNLFPCVNVPSFEHNVKQYRTLNYLDHVLFNQQNPSNQIAIPQPNLCAGNFSPEPYDTRVDEDYTMNIPLIEAFNVDGGPGVRNLQGNDAESNFVPCKKNNKHIQVCRHCTASYKKPNIHDPCFEKGKTFGGINQDGSYKCI